MKRPKTPNLVTIFVLTTITLIFWVFFSVYRAFSQQPAPGVAPEILEPLTPTLDAATIDKIEGRTFFAEGQVPQIPILTVSPSGLPSPQGAPTPTPTATIEAALSPTPTATESPTPTP